MNTTKILSVIEKAPSICGGMLVAASTAAACTPQSPRCVVGHLLSAAGVEDRVLYSYRHDGSNTWPQEFWDVLNREYGLLPDTIQSMVTVNDEATHSRRREELKMFIENIAPDQDEPVPSPA